MYYEVPEHSTAYALRIEPVRVLLSPLESFRSYHCPGVLKNVKLLGLTGVCYLG
jgi:hypothetical protein